MAILLLIAVNHIPPKEARFLEASICKECIIGFHVIQTLEIKLKRQFGIDDLLTHGLRDLNYICQISGLVRQGW